LQNKKSSFDFQNQNELFLLLKLIENQIIKLMNFTCILQSKMLITSNL